MIYCFNIGVGFIRPVFIVGTMHRAPTPESYYLYDIRYTIIPVL